MEKQSTRHNTDGGCPYIIHTGSQLWKNDMYEIWWVFLVDEEKTPITFVALDSVLETLKTLTVMS